MTPIKDLITLPEHVHRGDFVLRLTEGVEKPVDTLRDYVVTPQLVECFDDALRFIKGALDARNSKAAYLHGSFGSGKSHFMAVLHLLLQHDHRARAQEGLERVCVKHDWVEGKRFLLVPYHMINARSMESAILGGYADHVGDLVKHLFQGYSGVSAGKSESFLSLDKGLSVISRHARDLGYDGLILFLDELILWLASHAARPDFVHQEGQKLAKLVESQTPDRPVPLVSFV